MSIPTSITQTAERDSSGFQFFSRGELGAAHAMAHRMLDSGHLEEGHRWLGSWLHGRVGFGSQWVHVQWHMMVFEIAVGEWHSACARFRRNILPAAATSSEALTDAPAALWRLVLASTEAEGLPWDIVRDRALSHLYDGGDHYVTLHNLLALAGAADFDSIARWLSHHDARTAKDRVLEDMARGLYHYARGQYAVAAASFRTAIPQVSMLGGSRAQNELFADIYRRALARSAANDNAQTHSRRLAAVGS